MCSLLRLALPVPRAGARHTCLCLPLRLCDEAPLPRREKLPGCCRVPPDPSQVKAFSPPAGQLLTAGLSTRRRRIPRWKRPRRSRPHWVAGRREGKRPDSSPSAQLGAASQDHLSPSALQLAGLPGPHMAAPRPPRSPGLAPSVGLTRAPLEKALHAGSAGSVSEPLPESLAAVTAGPGPKAPVIACDGHRGPPI